MKKNRIYESISFKIIASYILLSLITLSFIISIIFENQIDLISKNTILESEKQISQLIDALKKITNEMKKGSLFKSGPDKESDQHLIKIITLHFNDFFIIDDKHELKYSSADNTKLPESFRDDCLRAMTASTFSGKEYYLRIDEPGKIMNVYIPLNDFYQENVILLIKKDISVLNKSLGDLYKQTAYVVIVIFFFHLLFAGFLYRSFIMPLKTLRNAAVNFSNGDTSIRISLPANNYEFDTLALAFNKMADSAHNNITNLSAEMEILKNLNRKLDKNVTRDELTNLVNGNYLIERINEEFNNAGFRGNGLSLIYIDIDDFGIVNNRYGMQTGNIILMETAKKISQNCMKGDIAARAGGEEFAILSLHSDEKTIHELADRIKKTVADHRVITPDGNFSVTVSIGAAIITAYKLQGISTHEEIIASAKSALEKAKANGKNRVEYS